MSQRQVQVGRRLDDDSSRLSEWTNARRQAKKPGALAKASSAAETTAMD